MEVKLDFKQGRTLSIMKKKITVEATFRSTVPISLTTMLVFSDDLFNRFSLPLSATSDNSLFTLYSYLELSEGEFRVIADDKDSYQLVEAGVTSDYSMQSRKRLNTQYST